MSDANRGSYLSPEPLLQDPTWVASQLRSGQQVPTYSYALNNPIAHIDPNGLDAYVYDRVEQDGIYGHAGVAVEPYCRGDFTCRASVPVYSYEFYCDPYANGESSATTRCLFSSQPGRVFSSNEPVPVSSLAAGVQGRSYRVRQLPMSCEETAATWDRLQAMQANPPNYNAVASNCRDFVRSALGQSCPAFYAPDRTPAGANGGAGRRF